MGFWLRAVHETHGLAPCSMYMYSRSSRARTEASVFWARRGLRQPDVSQEGPRVAQPPSTQKTRCPSTRFELHRSSCTTRRGALIAAFQQRNELQ